jgi:hypothetical protein
MFAIIFFSSLVATAVRVRRARRRAPRREEARRQVASGPEREEVPVDLQDALRHHVHLFSADASLHGRDSGTRRGVGLLARDGALLFFF